MPRDCHRVRKGLKAVWRSALAMVRSLRCGPVHAPCPDTGGFTLIELLLVLVIFSLSIAVVYPRVSPGLTGVTAKSTAKKAAAALNHARVLAVRDRENYYVRFNAGQVVVEPAKRTGARKEVPVSADVKIEFRDSSVVAFYPAGGSSGGVFEVKGPGNTVNYIIQVEPSTGSVSVYPSRKENR